MIRLVPKLSCHSASKQVPKRNHSYRKDLIYINENEPSEDHVLTRFDTETKVNS